MATFVLKVNAHPAFTPFPNTPLEWENRQFFGPASRSVIGGPEQVPMPAVNDRVHVWINERGGGGGYTGYGKVVHYAGQTLGKIKRPTYEFRLAKIRILPAPLKGDCFWEYGGEAISSIRRYTLRQLLWINTIQAREFEAALREIVRRNFGEPFNDFV
ncbi:hypothetical protein RJJ65_20685 [Rhizobium hidalgonense]|uniref:Uncharacterized protein n=1 Tax=Rhizobium hidalgonense TaxID=1538159 RepID=A0AAJ2GU89_9HYPH|nr:hypothetical protein [Rhizobium hidalgonense]MDR9775026.1 hypothetical protein [Rhizobium hidalgonense]